MVETREEIFNKISKSLAITKYDIEHRQSINDYCLNIHSENFFRDILNFIYGYELVNSNKEKQNTPYIDLVDNKRRLFFQVTTTRTKEKIEVSIENNILNGKKQIIHRKGATLDSLQIVDEFGNHTMQVEMTKSLKFIIGYKVDEILDNPAIAISFYNNKNMLITTIVYDLVYDKNFIEIQIPFMLEAGEYSFNLTIAERTNNSGKSYQEYTNIGPISVTFDFNSNEPSFYGLVGLDYKINFKD